MKRLIVAMALLCGALFCCPKVEAKSNYILPRAGFQSFMDMDIKAKKLPRYILTDHDADLLLRIGVLEAGSTDTEGIAQVMQVVLNRTFNDKRFPSSVEGVIFQEKQFTTASKLAKANITPEAYVALDCVIFGEYKENESLYFESMPGKVWANVHEYQFSYGGHDFYK